MAQVMGQPERCQHAVHLINELVHTAQVHTQPSYTRHVTAFIFHSLVCIEQRAHEEELCVMFALFRSEMVLEVSWGREVVAEVVGIGAWAHLEVYRRSPTQYLLINVDLLSGKVRT